MKKLIHRFVRFLKKMFPPHEPRPPLLDLTPLRLDMKAKKLSIETVVSNFEDASASRWKKGKRAELMDSLYVRTVYHLKQTPLLVGGQEHESLVFEVFQNIPGLPINERPTIWVALERTVQKRGKEEENSTGQTGHRSGEEAISPGEITSDDDATHITDGAPQQDTNLTQVGDNGEGSERPKLSDAYPKTQPSRLPNWDRNSVASSVDGFMLSSAISLGAGDYVRFRDRHPKELPKSKILHSYTFLEDGEPDDFEVGDGSNNPKPTANFKASQNLRASTRVPLEDRSTGRLLFADVLLAARSINTEFPNYNLYRHQCFWYASLLWALLIDPEAQRGRLEVRRGKTLSGTIIKGKIGFPFIPPQQEHLERVRTTYEAEKVRFGVEKEAAIQYIQRGDEEAKKRELAEQLATEEARKRAEADKKRQSAEQLATEEARKRVEAERETNVVKRIAQEAAEDAKRIAQEAAEEIRALKAALAASKNATASSS